MKRDTSALTRRRGPLREGAGRLREIAAASLRFLLKDRFSLFLLLASIALSVTFFVLLNDLKPESPGEPTALSTVIQRAQDKKLLTATLLDYDSRVVVTTADGRLLWASYPSADAQTTNLIRELSASGTVVVVDQQSSKPIKAIIVQ